MASAFPSSYGRPESDLRRQAADGVIWSVAASAVNQVISLLIFAILARQLSPLEFGIVAMAAIFLEVVNLVGRAGLVEVLVQRKELHEEDLSTAFWSSLGLGLLGTFILWASAGLIGTFFNVPEVVRVVQWLSIVTTVTAMGTVQEALLRRAFGFKVLALRGLVATLGGGATAAALAWTGFGVMSLVGQSLVAAGLTTAIMWHYTRWMPSFRFASDEFRRQIRIGMSLCISTLLGMGNQRIVDLVVGHLLGPVPLGFLRVAWRGFDMLLELGMRPVVQVSFPFFSRLQREPAQLSATYIHLARLTALIIFPVFVGAILIAPEFIRLAFGNQWDASVMLMQILALSVLSMPMIYFKSNALIAVGQIRPVLWLNVLEFGLSFVIVAVFCRFGVEGAAWGNVLRVVVVAVPILWALQRYVGIQWKQLLQAMVPAAVCTILMVAAALGVRLTLTQYVGPLTMVVSLVAAGALFYVGTLMLLYRMLFMELLGLAPEPVCRLLRAVKVLKTA